MLSQTGYKTVALVCLVLLMVIHIWLWQDRYGKISVKLSLEKNLQNHTTLQNYSTESAKSDHLTKLISQSSEASPFAMFLSKVLRKSKFEHKTTLLSRGGCGKSRLKLLVLISSDAKNTFQRNTIRNTWARYNKSSNGSTLWRLHFLVARRDDDTTMNQVLGEIHKYDDLVVGDYNENYYNQTLKVEMGLEWAMLYCNYQYMLKGDDDIFVQIPRLLDFLNWKNVPKKKLYTGFVNTYAAVERDKSGKHYLSKETFAPRFYPPYAAGGGFILSADLVDRLYPLLNSNRSHPFPIDDAYIGIMVEKIGVQPYLGSHEWKFQFLEWYFVYDSEWIVRHPFKSRMAMMKIFHKINATEIKRVTVSCGTHRALTCPECPEGHGASWCNGQCLWSNQTQTCQGMLFLIIEI